ncbi:unnamed protein product [Chilo suppressalis]|uniref:Uncharacterized protein n=1 Tax=Chilo suppressalis TaxID=168631 RepID=A0ABN8BI39_CHISP|nr:unnamed protein product [Chilo suppressalis]
MEKLRFEFVVKAIKDPKTNTFCITSITDTNKCTFLISEHFQQARLHKAVIKTTAFQKAKTTTLQKTHEKDSKVLMVRLHACQALASLDNRKHIKGRLRQVLATYLHVGQRLVAIVISRRVFKCSIIQKNKKIEAGRMRRVFRFWNITRWNPASGIRKMQIIKIRRNKQMHGFVLLK